MTYHSTRSLRSARRHQPLPALALALAALALTTVCTACTSAASPPAAPTTTGAPSSQPVPSTAPSEAAADPEQLEIARALTDALNRGDSAAARALFSPTARFDSVGRIYPDRDAIFARFINPEVIALGGTYTELSAQNDEGRLVVEYNFATRSGGREHFTYAYLIENNLIADVVGDYV